jgi:hypothetical protein
MKNASLRLSMVLSLGVLFLSPTGSVAQWQPDVRLTNNSARSVTSSTNAWCVAASGSLVHVVWYDFRDGGGTPEIYYKHSTDGGVSWAEDTRLTMNPAISWFPSIAASGSLVHLVWQDDRDGNNEVYYKRSTDGGVSWGADIRLTNDPANSYFPSVAVSDSVVHVVWYDDRDGAPNFEIYYKRSTDGGVSWGADTRLTNAAGYSLGPSVAVSGAVVHVVWQDTRDGNYEIYYKRSTDGGVSWAPDTRLTNDTAASWIASVATSGSLVHVVWGDERDGNHEIYYKRSADGGISWLSDTRLTNNAAGSYTPSVAVSGSVVHVVWRDDRDGNPETYYKRSIDGGGSWAPDTRLTNNTANSYLPSVALSGSAVHVVWHDNRDGNYEIYYKQDPTGNPTSVINVDDIVPREYRLFQNYPNPFNPSTRIRFSVRGLGFEESGSGFTVQGSRLVTLKVYDLLGREVATLVNENLQPGSYEVTFDASGLPSGVYFYRLRAGEFTQTKRMVLMR